jgi:hypothetical protein
MRFQLQVAQVSEPKLAELLEKPVAPSNSLPNSNEYKLNLVSGSNPTSAGAVATSLLRFFDCSCVLPVFDCNDSSRRPAVARFNSQSARARGARMGSDHEISRKSSNVQESHPHDSVETGRAVLVRLVHR